MTHPLADHLKHLAQTSEYTLLLEASRLTGDLDGMHAVLDAIELIQVPSPVFVEDRGIKSEDCTLDVRYSAVLASALDIKTPYEAFGQWDEGQRTFFRRLAPMLQGTEVATPLLNMLINNVADNTLCEELSHGRYNDAAVFIQAMNTGNACVAMAVEKAISDDVFLLAMEKDDADGSLGWASQLVHSYFNGDEGRAATDALLAAAERRAGAERTNLLRTAMIARTLPGRHVSSIALSDDNLLRLAGAPDGDFKDSFIPDLCLTTAAKLKARTRAAQEDSLHASEPVIWMVIHALNEHCAPLLAAAWPIVELAVLDPMKTACSSLMQSRSAFRESAVQPKS